MQQLSDFISITPCQENTTNSWQGSPALLPSSTRFGSSSAAFPCVFGHMRRRNSSHVSASSGAEASVKAARLCAPRSGRSALTDAGAEGTSPQCSEGQRVEAACLPQSSIAVTNLDADRRPKICPRVQIFVSAEFRLSAGMPSRNTADEIVEFELDLGGAWMMGRGEWKNKRLMPG
jgi:hypothetical protein